MPSATMIITMTMGVTMEEEAAAAQQLPPAPHPLQQVGPLAHLQA